MKEHNKRWLISVLKTSGSKRRYISNGSFTDERNTKKHQKIENMPSYESISSAYHVLNYGILVRFLRGKIGHDWDNVYSEIVSRIPTKLYDQKEIISRFVADKTVLINGNPYNKIDNKFIWTAKQGEYNYEFDNCAFYVCSATNKLLKVEDKSSKKRTKRFEKGELKKYRENEKKWKTERKKYFKEVKNKSQFLVKEILAESNKEKKE